MKELENSLISKTWIAHFHIVDGSDKFKPTEVLVEEYRKQYVTWDEVDDPNIYLSDLCYSDPKRALNIICEITELTDDDWLLHLLAAGPLETLLKFQPNSTKSRLDFLKLASKNPKLEKLQSYAWL